MMPDVKFTKRLQETPWTRADRRAEGDRYGGWHGEIVSVDGASTHGEFRESDVARVLAYGATPDDWDGNVAGVAELVDGRFIGWESEWGPTGSGFHEDAYGGAADILVANDLNELMKSFSAKGIELLEWQVFDDEDHDALSVLCDAVTEGATRARVEELGAQFGGLLAVRARVRWLRGWWLNKAGIADVVLGADPAP